MSRPKINAPAVSNFWVVNYCPFCGKPVKGQSADQKTAPDRRTAADKTKSLSAGPITENLSVNDPRKFGNNHCSGKE